MAYQPSGEVFGGDEFVQIDFGDELKRIYVIDRKCYRYTMTINGLSCQGHIGVVVTTEMVVIGAWMVVSGARRTMARSFDMQKTDLDVVRGGKPCFFNFVSDRKDGIDGKTYHHRHQGHCNYFSES